MRIAYLLSAALVTAGLTSMAAAQITGTVKLDGEPPEMREIDMSAVRECAQAHADPVYDETVLAGEEGELENVIIAIRAPEGIDLPGERPQEPAELDQEGCMYQPRVIAMMVGQDMIVKNSDPFLHNVNATPRQNPPFNIAQPNIHPGQRVPSPRVPERFRIRCDVHPWMTAWVEAFEHPYFAVTDMDGQFSIEAGELPDGEYELVAWHERYGEQVKTIEITDGKAEAEFTFEATAARADEQVRDVVMAMASGSGDGSDDKGDDKGGSCGTSSCCAPAAPAEVAAE
jgi:hypothetical protein